MIPPRTAAAALLLASAAGCGDGGSRPNVLLITLDTTRADYFGTYGRAGDPTPNFDALAREGARFDLCISTAAVTPVSHASILTGLYPYEHGLRVMYAPSGFRLPDVVHSLPEVLHERGWRTGAFLSSYPVSEDFGLDAGFDLFQWPRPEPGSEARTVDDGGAMRWDSQYQQRSDVTTEQAMAWLDPDRDDPFFAWIHYWDPHGGTADPPDDLLRKWVPTWNRSWQRGTSNMTNEMRERYYAAQVEMVDRQFGRLVDHLKATGQWEDTVVVVIADHGEGLGEHGWHAHRILYQEQIWLPLIARAPGMPAGAEVAQLVRSIDVFPSILELADVPLPARVSGRSFAGLWRGEREEGRVAYAEQLNRLDSNAKMVRSRPNDAFLHVVMDDRWKLVHRPEKPELDELFDIEQDPDEAVNLAAGRPDVREELLADLRSRGGDEGVIRMTPFEPSADGSAPNLQALSDLGYIGGEDEDEGEDGE